MTDDSWQLTAEKQEDFKPKEKDNQNWPPELYYVAIFYDNFVSQIFCY